MQFRTQMSGINAALDLVSVVQPKVGNSQGQAGYLVSIQKDHGYIYSRNALQVAKVEFPISESKEEGTFVLPTRVSEAWKQLDGWLDVESGQGENGFQLKYQTEGGATSEPGTLDPKLVKDCDEELQAANSEQSFPVAILREAIGLARPYLAKTSNTRADDHYKAIQIFDNTREEWKNGVGHLFAADGVRACYVYCEAFVGKSFAIHEQHLGCLTSFLSKCGDIVNVRRSDTMTFALDGKGQAIGWARKEKFHPKFSYYALGMDKYVLSIPKGPLGKAIRFARLNTEPNQDKIRIRFDHGQSTLRFLSGGKTESVPVPVKITSSDNKDLNVGVNGDYFLDLVEGVGSEDVELRIAVVPGKEGRKDTVLFRTLEEFWLDRNGKRVIAQRDGDNVRLPEGVKREDVFECRVTRFMPAKD